MGTISLYDEKALANLTKLQREHEWDLERSIDWSQGLDLSKPLVPLDEDALFFPGASQEQRLAISQMMGLIIAAAICEMEECLLRLRGEAWNELRDRYPVSPEFEDLGEQFFAEEMKHSQAFRRYLDLFANACNIDLETLLGILPKVENTTTEAVLRKNLTNGGLSFWWIVASVEQQFLLLYHSFRPFRQQMDPLYFELHHKHFEEEARHAPFPYLLIELITTRQSGVRGFLHKKGDLILSQFMQTFWTISTLKKTQGVKELKEQHPFFSALASAIPLLEKEPPHRILWTLLSSAPYVSSLVNLQSHKRILRFAEQMGAKKVPFPSFKPKRLVNY